MAYILAHTRYLSVSMSVVDVEQVVQLLACCFGIAIGVLL